MIFSFIQKERLPVSQFEIQEDDRVRATAVAPEFQHGILNVDGDTYELSFNKRQKVYITRNGAPFMEIVPQFCQTGKVLFVPVGYDYYQFTIGGVTYSVYEVGLGAEKHFYCIYVGDNTVAIIHKPDKVINHLDRYDCYLLSEEQFLAAGLFCLFLESGQYYNMRAIGNEERDIETVTIQKELQAKYNPDFIPRILAMHGLSID